MRTDVEKVSINGVEYVRADQLPRAAPNGNRAVVVVDRGWIFSGDVTEADGRIRLSRAVHVFSWRAIGFAKMIETEEADLRPCADVDLPADTEIFRVPVHDEWGLRVTS